MFTKDLVERVVATFVQASLGAMTSNSMFDLGVDQWKMMAGAGVAAAISVLKGALATKLGTKGTASLAD
ncbi:uncharacterized protein METZ01_LOCUS517348 [marine metagenome]|uniref:Holin n=1 Tax=marine metagenome TaxID=408172 RepID=A0A383F6H5_9ZZZZ